MADRLRRLARRLDRGLLPFMGPAQIGAGHPEEPYRLPEHPTCPICRKPMSDHEIVRSSDVGRSTSLICPQDA